MNALRLLNFDLVNCKIKQNDTLEFQANDNWVSKIYSSSEFDRRKFLTLI